MRIHEVRQFINHSSEFFTILKHLPSIESDGPWVAGGSVWKSIEGLPLDSDVDIFFKSPQQCEQWFRQLLSLPYVHRIVSQPKSNHYNTSLKYHIHTKGYNKTIKLQLISFRFFSDIEELLKGFDFTACQFGCDGQYLYSGDTSFDDLRNRDIIFNNILDNVATGIHLEKYMKLGFKVPSTQLEKYKEIVEKTKKFREKNPEPTPAPIRSGRIFSSWSEPPRALSSEPLNNDEDYAYPRPAIGESGINLSQITQMPARPPIQERIQSPSEILGNMNSGAAYGTTINTSYYSTINITSNPQPADPYPTSPSVPDSDVVIPMDYVTTAGTESPANTHFFTTEQPIREEVATLAETEPMGYSDSGVAENPSSS